MEVSLEANYFWYQCLWSKKKKKQQKHDQENEPISEE